jgi:hypothetical protein
VTGWGRSEGKVRAEDRVGEMRQNELLGRREMDFSTGEGERLKWVRVGMKR